MKDSDSDYIDIDDNDYDYDYEYSDIDDNDHTNNAKSFGEKIRDFIWKIEDFIWELDYSRNTGMYFAEDYFIKGTVKFTDHYPTEEEYGINYYEKISGLCKLYFAYFMAKKVCEELPDAIDESIRRMYIGEKDNFITKVLKGLGSILLIVLYYVVKSLDIPARIIACTIINSITAIENFVAKGATYCVKSIKTLGLKCKDSAKFCLSYIPIIGKLVQVNELDDMDDSSDITNTIFETPDEKGDDIALASGNSRDNIEQNNTQEKNLYNGIEQL